MDSIDYSVHSVVGQLCYMYDMAVLACVHGELTFFFNGTAAYEIDTV